MDNSIIIANELKKLNDKIETLIEVLSNGK